MTLIVYVCAEVTPVVTFLSKANSDCSGGCKGRGVAEVIPRGQAKSHAIVYWLLHNISGMDLNIQLMWIVDHIIGFGVLHMAPLDMEKIV